MPNSYLVLDLRKSSDLAKKEAIRKVMHDKLTKGSAYVVDVEFSPQWAFFGKVEIGSSDAKDYTFTPEGKEEGVVLPLEGLEELIFQPEISFVLE